MSLHQKRGRLRVNRNKEDLNPMDGLANLADAMLVFACGLLVALIVNWNVDVGAERKPQEIADGGAGETEIVLDESNLQEMGKVYKDPETGKLYIVDGE